MPLQFVKSYFVDISGTHYKHKRSPKEMKISQMEKCALILARRKAIASYYKFVNFFLSRGRIMCLRQSDGFKVKTIFIALI